jgi:hypothetical protein
MTVKEIGLLVYGLTALVVSKHVTLDSFAGKPGRYGSEVIMSERARLLKSIADITADYRAGEIPAPTPEHVDRWINQFSLPVQQPILAEMEHVLSRTYLTKANVQKFLAMLVKNPKLTGADPCNFWRGVTFLDIQGGGNSQRDMLNLFGDELRKACGFSVAQCSSVGTNAFIYLDDVLFSGNRIFRDLTRWIGSGAPKSAIVHVVTMGLHCGGQFYAKQRIEKAAADAVKSINLIWWRSVEIEDRRTYTATSDVLRPTSIPNDPDTQAYVQSLRYPPTLRTAGSAGGRGFFSSEQGRNLLEQEFLKTGVHIRDICPRLTAVQRPLGHMTLETLGFGSMIVTYGNCPNNAPLVLWAGNPWYPLFARKTN